MKINLKPFSVAILFVLSIFIGDRLLFAALSELTLKSQNRFVSIYKGSMLPGVIVLGNSRADRHFPPEFHPKEHGKLSNLGIGGQPTVLSEALLYDYVEYVGKPDMLIIEISNITTNPVDMAEMRLLSAFSVNISALIEKYHPRIYHVTSLFNIFTFNNELFLRVLLELRRPEVSRLHTGVISDALVDMVRQKLGKDVMVNETIGFDDNLEALLRMVTFAETEGIPLKLIFTPYFRIDEGHQLHTINRRISEIRRILGDTYLWDYSSRLIGARYFRDTSHMNKAGVQKFYEMLAEDGFFGEDGLMPEQ